MLSKEEIEFCSSLEKMFNYLKTKKELTEFEQQVIISFDYITKKVLSDECKTATEMVSKDMYYELVRKKEECYEKQIDKLESDKQKLIEKLEKRMKSVEKCYQDLIKPYYDEKLNMINVSLMSRKEKDEFTNKRNCLLVQKHCYTEILEIVKGAEE